MMKRFLIGLVILAGLWLYNGGYADLTGGASAGGGDPVQEFASGDAKMNAAMDQARATLPAFLANETDANGNAAPNTSVKVAFDIRNDGAEIIWVSQFQWDGGTQMNGLLSDQPNYMDGLNAGDAVAFTTDMVRDWSITEANGRMWSNYTTRVIVPQLDAETAAALGAMLSPDPVPSDWN